MPSEGTTTESPLQQPLLAPDEPSPFRILNSEASAAILLVCDHASRRFPKALGSMGLDPVAQICHLAWDIGAGAVTEAVAESLQVTAVLAGYSRLVVDCNRNLMDPSAFLEFGDGVIVPGNRRIGQNEKRRRAEEIYWPYHRALDGQIGRLTDSGVKPLMVAIHSFTPVLDGVSRPWEIGVLWDTDRPTAKTFIAGFRAAGFAVGDNEPYSGKAPADFTIDHHAEGAELPHVGIEIRHDLISQADGVARLAAVLENIVAGCGDAISNRGGKQPKSA